MVWSWSHTQGAYHNAEARLYRLSEKKLAIIYAEWRSHLAADDPHPVVVEDTFDEQEYLKGLGEAWTMTRDELAEAIWKWCSDSMVGGRNCDNGGYRPWYCPYGCGPHKGSWDPVEEPDEVEV